MVTDIFQLDGILILATYTSIILAESVTSLCLCDKVTCGRMGVFSGYPAFLHNDITEILFLIVLITMTLALTYNDDNSPCKDVKG
jgi:hypothetical protein